MLITFTQSGSLFNVDFQFDSFNQGDNNTHIVDVVVLDESFSNYEYNGYIQFIREGDKLPSDKFVMANKRIIVDGVAYNGYTFKMASDWYTAVAGVLKATIEIKKFSNGVMESNKAYGIVNIPVQASVSAISEVDSKITDEEYNSLVDLINSKLNKDDYDIEDLGYLDTNEDEAIKTAIQHRLNNYRNSNIYKYTIPTPGGKVDGIVILGYDLSAMWAVSISGNNIKSYEVDTTKNEVVLINRDVNVQQLSSTKANISNIKVNTNIEVPAPVGNANAVNKYYLDSNHYKKSEIDSSLQNVETNLNYNIQGALDSSKSYTDLKHNELKALLDTLLEDAPTAYDTLKKIADYIASDKTGASEMLAKINNNTSEINEIKGNLPETLDIILRSEVSEGTTEEVKEMEINGMKFKVGSATSSDSAIKGKLVASGEYQFLDSSSAEIILSKELEENKIYILEIYDRDNTGATLTSMFSLPTPNGASWSFICTIINSDNDASMLVHAMISNEERNRISLSGNNTGTFDDSYFGVKVYELVAPVGSGGTSNEILTLSDVEHYYEEDDNGNFFLYIKTKLNNQNLLIDFAKDFPDYQYKEINYFIVNLVESKNSQVLVKFDKMYMENLASTNEYALIDIAYELRLISMNATYYSEYLEGIATYEEESYVTYNLGLGNGTNIVKIDFDAFGNGTTYLSFDYEY